LPTLAVLALVVGYPVVYTLLLSVQDYNLVDIIPGGYVGMENYRNLFADPIFWQALANTGVYTFGSVIIAAFIGLVFALLTENLLGASFRTVRALLLVPWAVPFVVTAFLFRYMYLQNGGIVNEMLLWTGLISQPVP